MNEVIVFGASGYSGLELLRLLVGHPEVQVVGASSSKWSKEEVRRRLPTWRSSLSFESHEAVTSLAAPGRFAFLATPAETSAQLAPLLLERGVRVVDLSGAFRLKADEYPTWYGFEHPRPDLLAKAHYGLVDLFPPDPGASLVANPGCYATAAVLAAAPLVASGLCSPSGPIFIDGKSGTTGAGRKADEALLHAEVAENLRPYRLFRHQHTPEIEQVLGRLAGREVKVSFTAHLVPMRRGIIASVYAPAALGVTQAGCDTAFQTRFENSSFVRYLGKTPPETGTVAQTNFAELAAVYDDRTRSIAAFSAIDNLVKGAAGQAIENLNLLLGLPKETGLL